MKSELPPGYESGHSTDVICTLGRSYYCFALEQALTAVKQARAIVSGDLIEEAHELPRIEQLLADALEAT